MNAIIAEIRDSVTGNPAAFGARVQIQDGGFTSSIIASTGNSAIAALAGLGGARAGTYTVSVEKAGYRLWTKRNVEVLKNQCAVQPTWVMARLAH